MGRLLVGILVASVWLTPDGGWAQPVVGTVRTPPTRVDPPATRRDGPQSTLDRGDSGSSRPERSTMRSSVPRDGGWTIRGPIDDLYRATPDTYAPRYDRPSSAYGGRRHVMRGFGYATALYAPFMAASVYSQDRSNAEQQSHLRGQVSNHVDAYPRDRERIEDAKPYTPLTPAGVPKTFYVIPRCYAGDTPPRAEELPAGCDISHVRVVPPVASLRR